MDCYCYRDNDTLFLMDSDGVYFGSKKNAPESVQKKVSEWLVEREKRLDELNRLIQEDKKKRGEGTEPNVG